MTHPATFDRTALADRLMGQLRDVQGRPAAMPAPDVPVCTVRDSRGNRCGIELRPCDWLPGYLDHSTVPAFRHYPRPWKGGEGA